MTFDIIPRTFEGFFLEEKDFKTGMEGVTIGYNSHVIKYILMIQEKAEKWDKVLKALEQSGDLAIQIIMNLEKKQWEDYIR